MATEFAPRSHQNKADRRRASETRTAAVSRPGRTLALAELTRLGTRSIDGVPVQEGVVAPRILVVDDEPMLRALISRGLRDEGYDVVEAEDGFAALDLARSTPKPFDLVITDNRMRGMSGPKLAERLRELYPALPVLHLSGSFDADPEGRPTLLKPFNRSDLLRTVRELLAG